MQSRLADAAGPTLAMLGPTNTGKTYRAIQRMLEHQSGMIGLPLRLLAREVYDRISGQVGENQVALITGEEKRVPKRPRFWVCTVEAMPMDRAVDFLAVDEVQLATHPQRGHVFCDRLIRARGRKETYFMGAATMAGAISQLVPTAVIRRHPRLSKLRSTGALSLTSLPPRTAIVAFSAREVYELAERLRHRRGGAAVVLGALSPRARNAQVAMYQAGEVDFLVATDAIGMGLNMDVDHVAFAGLSKFDGRRRRQLRLDEVAQIAGRAGRHTRDGTFGSLYPLQLHSDLRFVVESHRFAPVRRLVWRNSELDFADTQSLVESLKKRPSSRLLRLVDDADDFAVLMRLLKRDEVRQRASSSESVELLWRVCQVPDFRKLMVEQHAGLLAEIFLQLSSEQRVIDAQFVRSRVERLDDDVGDIDTLMMRMQFVRTWSYVSYQSDWLDDAEDWQQTTRRIEDKLSAALHERLVERFVERKKKRASSRRSSRSSKGRPVDEERLEVVSSGPFAKLASLRSRFRDGPSRAQPEPADAWVEACVEANYDAFQLSASGEVSLHGRKLGRLCKGNDPAQPRVELDVETALSGGMSARLLRRLRALAHDFVNELFEPIRSEGMRSSARRRALSYALEKQFGVVALREVDGSIARWTKQERQELQRLGVEVGERYVYVADSLTARGRSVRAALCVAYWGRSAAVDTESSVAFALRDYAANIPWQYLGFPPVGPLALRADACERLLGELGHQEGPFVPSDVLRQSLDCTADDLEGLLLGLGYSLTAEGFLPPSRRSQKGRKSKRGRRSRRSRRGRSSGKGTHRSAEAPQRD